jgi:hypothetical protein
MDIDTFKATIAQNMLLDASRYTVRISGPIGALTKEQGLMCSGVVLPGRGFGTADKYTHGPIRKVPYAEIYDDISTTFYLTEKMDVHEYFNKWQTLIGGDDYYIAYYHDFIGSVIIEVENKRDETQAVYELFEAYPVSMTPIELGYALGGRVTEFTVNWSYHHFEKK